MLYKNDIYRFNWKYDFALSRGECNVGCRMYQTLCTKKVGTKERKVPQGY